MKRIALVLPLLLCLAGCPPIEQDAYKTVVASKAFLDSVKAKHPECAAAAASPSFVVANSTLCADLKKATAAKDLLIDAGETYCGGPQFDAGGACQAPAKGTSVSDQAMAKLKAALTGYTQAEADLKGVL